MESRTRNTPCLCPCNSDTASCLLRRPQYQLVRSSASKLPAMISTPKPRWRQAFAALPPAIHTQSLQLIQNFSASSTFSKQTTIRSWPFAHQFTATKPQPQKQNYFGCLNDSSLVQLLEIAQGEGSEFHIQYNGRWQLSSKTEMADTGKQKKGPTYRMWRTHFDGPHQWQWQANVE